MTNVNARYRVVEDGAYVAPGTCLTCGRDGGSDERGMTDTTKDLDFVGVVYICSYCVLEMAEGYGAASPQTQLNNLAAMEIVETQLTITRERLEKAEAVLNAVGIRDLLDIDPASVGINIPITEAPTVHEPEGTPTESPVTGETAQPGVTSETPSEGPDDFFDASGEPDSKRLDI